MQSKHTPASQMALGGVLAALAVVVMNLGTLIPVATYSCPLLCILLLDLVRRLCGSHIGWAWYGAVTILSLLMAPDKEAAAVFGFIGSYPLVKPRLDAMHGSILWKALFFNGLILILYRFFLGFLGLGAVLEEFTQMGALLTAVMLLLGNVIFFLMDRLLTRGFVRRK